jgi:predicted Zn finger-like uncharacterized protein
VASLGGEQQYNRRLMSLVTRCPACATTFKVVRDQLRISDGWVRCGRCSQVFDATLDLHEAPEAAPAQPAMNIEEADFLDDEHETVPPSAEAVPANLLPPLPDLVLPAASVASNLLPMVGIVADEPWPERPMPVAQEHGVAPLPTLPPFPNIDLTLPATPPAARDPLAAADDSGNAQLQKALRRARAKIAKAKARDEDRAAARESAPVVLAASEPEPPADAARRTPRPASDAIEAPTFWRREAVRPSLLAAVVLAAILLVVQVLLQERDLIVARQPALRPALAALCSLAGCELSALRQIGEITIDGASFAREKSSDAYRLSFTLRSAATVPLAMPAVELSLLDTQEQAVVRRVLMPAEFGAPPVLAARAERSASLPLALTGAEAAALPPIAGYRVVAFYP